MKNKKERIAILTDSCADIPPELAGRYAIFVLPLQIIFKDRSYRDGVDITAQEVYRRLPEEIPKTSLPSGDSVLELFQKIREAGYEKLVAIIFSSGLSGTYQLVRLLGQDFQGLEIATFDTLSGSLGTGAIVLQTALYVEEGRCWEEICALVPRLIRATSVFFCVDTLEYLQKGGRIGLITSIAGTMLQIKPIITFAPDGQLVNTAKVRGRDQSLLKLAELAASCGVPGKKFNLMVASGGSPEAMERVRQKLLQLAPGCRNLWEGTIDCTLGVHVGPNLVGAGIQLLDDDM